MSKTCNGCSTETKMPTTVPYQVFKDFKETAKANSLKWFIICLVLIVLLVGSNIGWLIYESQFETVETVEEYQIEQNAESGNNNSIINGGEVLNGETDNNLQENN